MRVFFLSVSVLACTDHAFAQSFLRRSGSLTDCGLDCDARQFDLYGRNHQAWQEDGSELDANLAARSNLANHNDGIFDAFDAADLSNRDLHLESPRLHKRYPVEQKSSTERPVTPKGRTANQHVQSDVAPGTSLSKQEIQPSFGDPNCMPPSPRSSKGIFVGPGLVVTSESEALLIRTNYNSGLFIGTVAPGANVNSKDSFHSTVAHIQNEPYGHKDDGARAKDVENALKSARQRGEIRAIVVVAPFTDGSVYRMLRTIWSKNGWGLMPTPIEKKYDTTGGKGLDYECHTFGFKYPAYLKWLDTKTVKVKRPFR